MMKIKTAVLRAVLNGFAGVALLLSASSAWSQQTMTAKIGDFRNGFLWILNAQGNAVYQPGVDHVAGFGGIAGDLPITGNWSGANCSIPSNTCVNVGIYRASTQYFLLDTNGDFLVGYGDQYFKLSIA